MRPIYLRQILIHWTNPQAEPTAVYTMARNPLEGVSRPPDRSIKADRGEVALEAYFWGNPAISDEDIINWCFDARIRP